MEEGKSTAEENRGNKEIEREKGLHHLKMMLEKRDRWREMEKNKKRLEGERDRERDHQIRSKDMGVRVEQKCGRGGRDKED